MMADSEKIKVLIVDGFSNHDWARTTSLIRGVLERTKRFLSRYGGHPQACGLTIIGEDNFRGFRQELEVYADETLAGLTRAAGHLRSELSQRLRLYSVPQLHFRYDDSIETGMRLSSLIDEAVASDKKPAP